MSKPSYESEAVKGHQMVGGRDSRIGKEAAVYVGHMKGYQGRLLEINRHSGKIEFPGGSSQSTYTTLLKNLVLM
jgi:transcription elongation factor